ncbi:hypothetical protein HHL28_14015 [Aerophototrophica crusticola]|uniref:N-acetyltransferase domain-containing protein n=1 Tax=Aerophototrophica crusticola TaxID=1709002 RepID=A0A858R8W0_9PROT|nr:hypothetical protein HHL28_14015 [Rhodospirillaceae bacterium B3]
MDAEIFYRLAREEAFAAASEELPDLFAAIGLPDLALAPVQLQEMDARGIAAWDRQWHTPGTTLNSCFAWDDEFRDIGAWPDRFCLAIWSGDRLCGLSSGQVRHDHLWIRLIEGNPQPRHPMRGAIRHVAIAAALAYTQVLGLSQVRLRPLNPRLGLVYQQMGFSVAEPAESPPYYWLEV